MIKSNQVWEALSLSNKYSQQCSNICIGDSVVNGSDDEVHHPEPAIYAAALAKARAEAHECFFTDDIAAYVDGARRAGMHAEQFLGYEKLLADLRGYGVDL